MNDQQAYEMMYTVISHVTRECTSKPQEGTTSNLLEYLKLKRMSRNGHTHTLLVEM